MDADRSKMQVKLMSGKFRALPLVRLLLLSSTSCLGGVADSTLSPYYCPAARQRGISVAQCGLVISARFITQIVFMLFFGRLMRNLGARRIYCIGVTMCSMFNIMFGTLEWVKSENLYFILSFVYVILSTVGDAGIFCSVYVLAASENVLCKPEKETRGDTMIREDENDQKYETNNKDEQNNVFLANVERNDSHISIDTEVAVRDQADQQPNAFGPAWMETTYACGTMAGPPLGGLLYEFGGFPLTFITTGVIMTITGVLTIPAYINKPSLHSPQSTQTAPNHFTILHNPLIFTGCLVMLTSGISISWYLPSLESFLTTQHSLTHFTIGFVYMVYGAVYTLLTPIFGHLIDKGLPHLPLLIFAAFSNLFAYLLIAPSPLLPFLPSNLSFTILGLLLNGLGVSANAITCLSLMTLEADRSGFGTGEATAGITTSLWEVSELLGCYLGSTAGGFAANSWGFATSTNCVVGVEATILLILITVQWSVRTRRRA